MRFSRIVSSWSVAIFLGFLGSLRQVKIKGQIANKTAKAFHKEQQLFFRERKQVMCKPGKYISSRLKFPK